MIIEDTPFIPSKKRFAASFEGNRARTSPWTFSTI
jgi:hypothetical protein